MSGVHLTRRGVHPKTGKVMARFYRMLLAPTLFGECALIREWGRIGSGGTVKVEAYPNAGAALLALQAIVRDKTRKGYVSATHPTGAEQLRKAYQVGVDSGPAMNGPDAMKRIRALIFGPDTV